MEAIFKQCNTKYWNATDEEMKEVYFKRMMLIEKTMQPYVEQILGVKKFLTLSRKEINDQQVQLPR